MFLQTTSNLITYFVLFFLKTIPNLKKIKTPSDGAGEIYHSEGIRNLQGNHNLEEEKKLSILWKSGKKKLLKKNPPCIWNPISFTFTNNHKL